MEPLLTDTHCHLDDPSLIVRLDEVLTAARKAGVDRIIVPGVTPEGWSDIGRIARRHSRIFAAFGIHPMHAYKADEQALSRLAELAREAVAIGEIGLDYLCPVSRHVQQAAFRAQLRVAADAGIPVLIHCRRAFQDLLAILHEENISCGGVMHAYSGSAEIMAECLKLGLHIAVSGVVTRPNAVRPTEIARLVPADRLLLETDAPDMTPIFKKGSLNEPAFLPETAQRVAELRGTTVELLATLTTRNALSLFRRLGIIESLH
jgi:TatD DNase family protein